jgi:hypothetical protein
MFIVFLLSQLPTDPPTTLAAMNWVVIGGLVGALVYVFRQWQKERRNCTQRYIETIDELMSALHDQLENPEVVDLSDRN